MRPLGGAVGFHADREFWMELRGPGLDEVRLRIWHRWQPAVGPFLQLTRREPVFLTFRISHEDG